MLQMFQNVIFSYFQSIIFSKFQNVIFSRECGVDGDMLLQVLTPFYIKHSFVNVVAQKRTTYNLNLAADGH